MSEYNYILNRFGLASVPAYVYNPNKGVISLNPVYPPIMPINLRSGSNPEYNQQNPDTQYKYFNSTEAKVYSSQFLGVPVFCDLVLEGTTQPPLEPAQLLQVLATLSRTKQVVQTSVQGRNGTVKEYISAGDYSITLQGAIFDSNKTKYPADAVKTLVRLLDAAESLKVVSPYLNDIFDIHYLVVLSYDMPQEAGFQHKQAFSIKAVSDDIPELIIQEQNA